MPYHRRQAALGQNKRSVTQMTASCFLTCSVPSLPPPSRACCFLGYTLQHVLCCLWACALPGPFAWSSISLPSAWLSSFSPTLRCQLDADAHLRSVARTLRTAPHSTFIVSILAPLFIVSLQPGNHARGRTSEAQSVQAQTRRLSLSKCKPRLDVALSVSHFFMGPVGRILVLP